MPGPLLYSTNPWFSSEVARKYRGGKHFVWVCECFDSSKAPAGSAASMIAPTSNPQRLYQQLHEHCEKEDEHSAIIKGHKKTFTRLSRLWVSDNSITRDQSDEILATVRSNSWKIWRPVLYLIPRAPIEASGRLISVKRPDRAGYGPEMQIADLEPHEFDTIEMVTV